MKILQFIIAGTRKIVVQLRKPKLQKCKLSYIDDAEFVANLIYQLLIDDRPCMIARFGSNELDTLTNYLGKLKYEKKYFSCILGETPKWWWTQHQFDRLKNFAGFINPSNETFCRFSELMIQDMKQVDILGSWRQEELLFAEELNHVTKVKLSCLEPFWSEKPWTLALKGKKVLVIHPFAETVEKQYKKRTTLFANKDILPDFQELHVIKAIQSIGGHCEYTDWFEALKSMEEKMDKIDYDFALIGCGAYGFPLAAHAKRTGHKAIHLGGALQLLFGIAGKRWFDPKSVRLYSKYKHLLNDSWVYPDADEKPQGADNVEGGCYW